MISRSKLKKAAKLAISIHGMNLIEGIQPHEIELTNDEWIIMTEEIHKICEKLAGNNPMNYGSVNDCIKYFTEKNYNTPNTKI